MIELDLLTTHADRVDLAEVKLERRIYSARVSLGLPLRELDESSDP